MVRYRPTEHPPVAAAVRRYHDRVLTADRIDPSTCTDRVLEIPLMICSLEVATRADRTVARVSESMRLHP